MFSPEGPSEVEVEALPAEKLVGHSDREVPDGPGLQAHLHYD